MAEEKKQPARKPAAKKTTSRKPAAAKTTRSRKPKVTVTGEQIAERAYYIWADGSGGGEFDNWLQAERELTTA